MSELNTESQVLWWHLFVRGESELEANVVTVFGESTKAPSEVAEIGLGFDNPHYYVTSFDHDPDEDETNNAILNKLVEVMRTSNLRMNGPDN